MQGNETTKKPTLGQRRVRVDFNPSKTDYVHQIKMAGANFIDLIDMSACKTDFTEDQLADFERLKELAMTAVEDGTMWAVKSATV